MSKELEEAFEHNHLSNCCAHPCNVEETSSQLFPFGSLIFVGRITLETVFAQGFLGCGDNVGTCWVASVGSFPLAAAVQRPDQHSCCSQWRKSRLIPSQTVFKRGEASPLLKIPLFLHQGRAP